MTQTGSFTHCQGHGKETGFHCYIISPACILTLMRWAELYHHHHFTDKETEAPEE